MTTFANPTIEAAFVQQQLALTEVVTAVVAPAPPRPVEHVVRRTDLLVEAWGWEQLRDYLNEQIRRVTGTAPAVDALKMSGICKGFVRRWGADARLIAEAAFGPYHGYWRSSPISITRFTEGNDDYFARPILEQIRSLA